MKLDPKRLLRALAHVLLVCGILAALGIGLYQYSVFEAKWLSVEHITVPIEGLPSVLEGFRIAQLSDLHLHPYTEVGFIEEAVEAVNKMEPDLVVLTGDYVTQRAEDIWELTSVLAELEAPHGIYAILGNHDGWTDAATVRSGLEKAGVTVLINSGAYIRRDEGVIYLAGLDDSLTGQPDIATALHGVAGDVPVILLAHEPYDIERHSKDGRIVLQLSGHIHGGKLNVPVLGPILLSERDREYSQGLYQVNDTWLYVNRGLGTIGLPIRFNCRPEVTEITLTRVE